MATTKQRDYINDLLDTRDLFASPEFFDRVNAMDAEELRVYVESIKTKAAELPVPEASALIDRLKALPRKGGQRSGGSGSEPEAGMYRDDEGDIIRVYFGQQSGRMLAKRLVSHGDHHEYEYMGAASRFVGPNTTRLSLEEAKEFGRMTGHCCVCARRLDDPESVEAGIGPVCARRFS